MMTDEPAPEAGRDRTGVQAVHLTLDILEEMMALRGDMGVSELSTRLMSTKGTVFRHLQTLVQRGYLVQDPRTQRYRLGARAHLLGQAASGSVDLLAVGTEALNRLQAETGHTAVLSSIFPKSVTVLATKIGKGALEIGVRPGSELPLHASAQGKIALAFGGQDVSAVLRRRTLDAFTAHTPTDIARLGAELPAIRAQGWASAYEEMMLGINAIAAPVFDGGGACVAALAIVGSIQFLEKVPAAAQIEALTAAAARVSSALGYRP